MKRKIIAYVVSAVMVLTMIPATAFAATDTGAGGVSKTAPDQLTQSKEKAVGTLAEAASDTNLLKYDTAGADSVKSIIDNYSAQIRAAATASDVNSLLTAARAEISAVATAEKIVKDYRNNLVANNDYETADLNKLSSIRDAAIADIKAAKTNAEIDTIIAEAKADMDEVAKARTLAEAKATAETAIKNYINIGAYEGASYSGSTGLHYDALVSDLVDTLDDCETVADVDAFAPVDIKGNLTAGTAETGAKDRLDGFISAEATTNQQALIDAIDDAMADIKAEYGTTAKAREYGIYSDIFDGIVQDATTYSGGYFNDAFGDYYNDAIAYNKAIKEGKTIDVAKVADVVAEIEADIAAVPTEAEEETLVADFTKAVAGADETDYDTLCDLLTTAGYLRDAAVAASGSANDPAYKIWNTSGLYRDVVGYGADTSSEAYKDTLLGKAQAYNDEQKTLAETMTSALPGAAAVTTANYLSVEDQVKEIDEVLDGQIDGTDFNEKFNVKVYATSDLTGYTDLSGAIKSVRDKAINFVKEVEKIEDDKEANEGYVWDGFTVVDGVYEITDMEALIKTYTDDIKGEVLSDDKVKTDDMTLAEAITAYEAAIASYTDAKESIAAVETLIGRIPTVVTIADKDVVDAAFDAYVALPDEIKTDYSTNNLKNECSALVKAYDTALDKALTDGEIDTWQELTAEVINLYNTIDDMIAEYNAGGITIDGSNYAKFTALKDGLVSAYNGAVTVDESVASANAASEVAKIIKDIPRDPAEATEADFAAVEEARAAYNALLTDEAKAEFEKAGYLAWLEDYEGYLSKYDLTMATITVNEKVVGSLPQVNRGTDPAVTVTDASGAVVPASQYKVEYQDDNHAGLATVIATGTGSYKGEVSTQFVVVNNAKKILSLKSNAKKTFTVKYNDYSKHNCTGTQIQWSSKKGTWYDKYTKNTSNKASKKISVAKPGKKYVRVRPIVNINGERYYGDWSKVKTVNVK